MTTATVLGKKGKRKKSRKKENGPKEFHDQVPL
jgi:hypothetical protein